jgi:hypothetical protein
MEQGKMAWNRENAKFWQKAKIGPWPEVEDKF